MWARRLAFRWERLRRNPAAHWCVLFIVLAVTIPLHNNNANPYSRFALLEAIAEDHSLAIDAYRDKTCDWSKTPDGRYYSNKAPGPVLLALPLYLPLDAAVVAHATDRKTRDARRLQARDTLLDALSIVLQVLPFAFLVLLSASMLAARGVSRPAIELATLAMLFGNTASLLMNMFHGHGLAALLTLGLALAFIERRMFLVGLLLGLDVLCDYGSALFVPIVLLLVLALEGRERGGGLARLLRVMLGAVAPLLAFVAYHALCFGGPFVLPNKYQNPVFVDKGGGALWGVIDRFPNAHRAFELLFGNKRSLWVTQPWVLLLAGLLLVFAWRRRGWTRARAGAARIVLPLAFGGLAALLVMNASFGGWHGGVSPGPRYLSAILPLVGLALGLSYDLFPRPVRIGLWLSMLPALALFIIIWAGDVTIWPDENIWPRCYATLFKSGPVKTYLRLGFLLLGFVLTASVALFRSLGWPRARDAQPSLAKPEPPVA